MITLVVMTDGRLDYLGRSLTTVNRLHGGITRRVLHDDTGDDEYRGELADVMYPDWEVIGPPRRAGFAGAYRSMWEWVRDHDTNPFVFTTEDDFRFTRDVDLASMVGVLTRNPHLTQLALRRQPWNDVERAAGGVVESNPDAYESCGDHLEHRLFHTTNPSLMRRELFTANEWPLGANSEGRFAHAMFANPHTRAGFWGRRDSGEWVEHIGAERRGHGY